MMRISRNTRAAIDLGSSTSIGSISPSSTPRAATSRSTCARGWVDEHPGSWHATDGKLSQKVPREPATDARAESPRSERQADAVAFLVERYVVHQVADDEQPAPVLALEVVGVGRIGDPAGIEAVAVIHDVDPDDAVPQLDADTDDAVGILARAIANRVAEGFGEGGPEVEADAARREGARGEMTGDQVDGIPDHAAISGHGEPRRSAPAAQVEAG